MKEKETPHPCTPLEDRPLVGLRDTLGDWLKSFDDLEPYFQSSELYFECTECGKCCERPGFVYLTSDDIEKLARHFSMTVEEVKISMLERDGSDWVVQANQHAPCSFYRDGRCDIHEVKPMQCRTYPFWHEVVGTRQAWRKERFDCPGIGRGRRYEADEIKRLLVGAQATWGELENPQEDES